jgi:adenine-specific DNA-methyltransferase
MTTRTDLRQPIVAALRDFDAYSFPEAATRLFATLGYKSDRTIPIASVADFCRAFDQDSILTGRERESLDQLTSLHFLFQLTDAELTLQRDLLDQGHAVDSTRIHSYLFFAAELPPGLYTRTFLSAIARAVNKPLAMPAMVLLRHGDNLSLAIIHRRLNKRQADRDVLEKATLIKDVCFADPIRAHLEILNDFSFDNLNDFLPIHNFVTLHQAWQNRLDTYSLNDRFYQEIADWYFWAKHLISDKKIIPPPQVDTDPERSLFLIRMLTRLIFCWFLQEKRMLPGDLFREHRLKSILKDFHPSPDERKPDLAPSYYCAILQNLFFATLNQPQTDDQGNSIREFRERSATGRFDPNRGITNLWRYKDYFRDPAEWPRLMDAIPFLNGGLFDCLDQKYQKSENRPHVILDGFSDNPDESTLVPNDLFFGPERNINLSTDYGEQDKRTARSKKAKVRGLIQILSRYKFTMEENTPLDQEIALDPELLGKVFENLLASYNPETRDTARKQTGSFYTPREVVSFMVDEAIVSYLEPTLGGDDPAGRLRTLFAAAVEDYAPDFDDAETDRLVAALDGIKILDPACGSGAYPMGALHRLVDLLRKLDPENKRWEARQRARLADEKTKAEALKEPERRQESLAGIDRRESEFKALFNVGRFDRDYARKLFLIENAIFGSDIQPVAVQIAKLRFFIALICDQKTDLHAPNQGVLPLPNLETRIVAANTLMPIPEAMEDGHVADLFDTEVRKHRARLQEIRHEHFAARHPATKKKCREKDAAIRKELADLLQRETHLDKKVARMLADWDPYDQNTFAPFFDPAWMFSDAYLRGSKAAETGFDIVIGNPPYVRQEKIKELKDDLKPHYPDTFTGTADLYVYFYDRALQLLRPGGILSYISSNKWYRAAYGAKLRAYLGKTATLIHAIDFGDAPVFTAIAYPTIVIARKNAPTPKHAFRALNWDPATPNSEIANFAAFYSAKSSRIAQSSLTADGWRFMARKGQDLLEKIRKAGTPLGEFVKGRFYRGVLTGLNEAFVVDRATRDRLIAEDPKSKEILKPFLRGRDVKRWRIEYEDLWLILIESSENKDHPWTGKKEEQAEKIFKARLPAIHAHFDHLRENLIARCDQGKYFWELRSCAYYEAFSGPKVIYPDIYEHQSFAFDDKSLFSTNTTYFIPHETHARFLTAILNSTAVEWFYGQISNRIRGGYLRAFSDSMQQIPIPPAESDAVRQVECLHDLIAFLNNGVSCTTQARDPLMRDYYEKILNALVCELYLPEEVHAAGLHFFELVEAVNLPRIDPKACESNMQITALRHKFDELYAPSHSLRAALQKLHALDPVKIMEGKG